MLLGTEEMEDDVGRIIWSITWGGPVLTMQGLMQAPTASVSPSSPNNNNHSAYECMGLEVSI